MPTEREEQEKRQAQEQQVQAQGQEQGQGEELDSPKAILAQPKDLVHSGRRLPNRFLKSAMTERLCSWDDLVLEERGHPTPEYRRLYEEWGKNGITLVTGNMPVDVRHAEARRNACIDRDMPWDPAQEYKPTIEAAHRFGGLLLGQLTHAGRQAPKDVQPYPISSGDVQCPPAMGMEFAKPRPMTKEEIKDVVDRFAWSARALYDAGADGVQLHSAHGYLLSQFLSPRVNNRKDEYGGPLENRARIVFEIIDAIKARVPDKKFILAIKINSQDFIDGGFDANESRTMCIRLEGAGVDLIELSGGTYEAGAFIEVKKESTRRREAFFIEFADRIRPNLKHATLTVTGGFRHKGPMARAVAERSTDVVGLARPLCAEPYLCKELLENRSDGAKPNLVPAPLQTPAAICQIHDIAKGRLPPTDLSRPEIAQRVVQSLTRIRPSRADILVPHGSEEETRKAAPITTAAA